MNRWARIQLGIGALGIGSFAAVGLHGLLSPASDEMVALHAQLALLATLLVVLSFSWVAIFLVACERGLRRLAAGPSEAAWTSARRRTVGWTVAGQVVLVGHFAAAGSLYVMRIPGWFHGASAAVTLALLVVAWLLAARNLSRHGARIGAAIEQRLP